MLLDTGGAICAVVTNLATMGLIGHITGTIVSKTYCEVCSCSAIA